MKVLTPAEVAEICPAPFMRYSDHQAYKDLFLMCDSHEALRAENTRLRGLIEGMDHEEDCAWQNCKGPKCNCVKSQVSL